MIDRIPRSYAEVAYDAFWVAALTENAAAGTKDINFLRKTFLQIANSYTGITGNTSLDEAGYRKYGDTIFGLSRQMMVLIIITASNGRRLVYLSQMQIIHVA